MSKDWSDADELSPTGYAQPRDVVEDSGPPTLPSIRRPTIPVDKKDYGKDRYDLLDDQAEAEMVRVMTWGATKYEDFGWKTIPHAKERYYAAAQRHLKAWRMGEITDPESGLPHLAHAACCIHFLQALDRT